VLIISGDTSAVRVIVLMMCLSPSIIVAYLLYNLRSTTIVVMLILFSIVLLPIVLPQISYGEVIFPLYFDTIVAALILIAAVVRQRSRNFIAQQRRELSESEGRFRDLFEATFDAIVLHDNGVIVDCNEPLEELLGLSRRKLIGRKVFDFIAPQSLEFAAQNINSNSASPYEIYVRNVQGNSFPVEVRGKTRRYRGQMLRVATVRELTDRKQAEARQVEVAVEREKVNVLQRFISNMSHDLRTPLTVIKTSVYLITRLKDDPEKLNNQISVLQAQVDQMQKLMEDLLSMSKLDKADTSDYRFQWVNLNTPTAQAVEDQQNLAMRREQHLIFQPGEELPNVLIDDIEYKRMVKHLILNGLGYTPAGGTVTVTSYVDGEDVIVAVQDTGKGISPLELPFIFERFYRTDRIDGSADGGTGLGLNIARKIAEAHSGTIEVESEVGKGSTFRIRLPVLSEDDAQAILNAELTKDTHD
jgi:PAS domain S-box-containing protein